MAGPEDRRRHVQMNKNIVEAITQPLLRVNEADCTTSSAQLLKVATGSVAIWQIEQRVVKALIVHSNTGSASSLNVNVGSSWEERLSNTL